MKDARKGRWNNNCEEVQEYQRIMCLGVHVVVLSTDVTVLYKWLVW